MSGTPFSERLAQLEDQLTAACHRAGRTRESVKLMAVSKIHPAEAIAEAFAAGLRLFGENRVQEFQQKSTALESLNIQVAQHSIPAAYEAQVHLIGHLQSNKAARATELFTAVDTVDSLKLAQRLHEAASRLNRQLPIFIEIKLSEETTKTGFTAGSNELSDLLEQLPELTSLRPQGLMTVAPLDENPETARSCFRQLRQLRDNLAAQHPRLSFDELSMGMSGDFPIAIEEGSTLIRIGTALFGSRPGPA
jgi:pyridoxal phosphate enzyme (YggS family)